MTLQLSADSRYYQFWNYTTEIDFINEKIMKDYIISKMPSLEINDNATVVDSVGIHYRCGDNLDHELYGVFPFSTYRGILSEVVQKTKFSKVIIYTDSKSSDVNGWLCWSLLGELQTAIRKVNTLADIEIDLHFLVPDLAISLLHVSKVIICASSTFCLRRHKHRLFAWSVKTGWIPPKRR